MTTTNILHNFINKHKSNYKSNKNVIDSSTDTKFAGTKSYNSFHNSLLRQIKKTYSNPDKTIILFIDHTHYIYMSPPINGNVYLVKNCKETKFINTYSLIQKSKYKYANIQSIRYSPSLTNITYTIDAKGNNNFYLFQYNVETNKTRQINLHKKSDEQFVSLNRILSHSDNHFGGHKQMSSDYMYLDNNTIIYITYNKYYNSVKCCSYNIDTGYRRQIYKSNNNEMLSLYSTNSNEYILLYASSYTKDNVYKIPLMDTTSTYKAIRFISNNNIKSTLKKYSYIDHHETNKKWYILERNTHYYKFYIKSPGKNTNKLLIKSDKDDDTVIHNVLSLFNKYVFFVSKNADYYLLIYDICKDTISKVRDKYFTTGNLTNYYLDYIDTTRSKLYFSTLNYTKPSIKYSLDTINMNIDHIGKGKDYSKDYNEQYIKLSDTICLTIINKKGHRKSKNNKCIVIGYGSYGSYQVINSDRYNFQLLCDKGYVIVFTSISGDGTLGTKQYINGLRQNKINSINDFHSIITFLLDNEYTNSNKLAIWGRSAGGFLIGSFINMYPELAKVTILGVPFVTPLLSMSSYKNPLGYESLNEWGSTNANSFTSKYSPFQNIDLNANYPNIFIYSNRYDTQVPQTEAITYFNYMRQNVTVFKDANKNITHYQDNKYGHTQGAISEQDIELKSTIFSYIETYLSK